MSSTFLPVAYVKSLANCCWMLLYATIPAVISYNFSFFWLTPSECSSSSWDFIFWNLWMMSFMQVKRVQGPITLFKLKFFHSYGPTEMCKSKGCIYKVIMVFRMLRGWCSFSGILSTHCSWYSREMNLVLDIELDKFSIFPS